MAYQVHADRNSGGFYGEEDSPTEYVSESSEESELREGSRGSAHAPVRRFGRSRSRAVSDEMEELCW